MRPSRHNGSYLMPMYLLKAEPDSRIVKGVDVKYSIDDLENDGTSMWEGVRNYQARNIMRSMKKGDLAFFYRSNCKAPAIVGLMEISKEAYPDPTAQDPKHPYFDSKSSDPERWSVVEVQYLCHLSPILLSELKENPKLKGMDLLKRSRLSVSEVGDAEFEEILDMAGLTLKEAQALQRPKDEPKEHVNEKPV